MNTNKKLALVTGGTSGIGREVALGLANRGYDLLVIARSESKVDNLKNEAKNRGATANIEYVFADLTLVSSVLNAVRKIKETYSQIDVLFFSAGLVPGKLVLTNERIEESFAVGYLSRFVITENLLPLLLKSPVKQIIAIASPGQGPGVNTKINFNDINYEKGKFKTMKTVGQFQHANEVYFTHIEKNNQKNGLSCYLYNPGVVKTGIHKNWPLFIRLMMKTIMRPMMITAEQSAEYPLKLIEGSYKPQTGMFNFKGKSIEPSKIVLDSQYSQRLVDLSRKIVQGI